MVCTESFSFDGITPRSAGFILSALFRLKGVRQMSNQEEERIKPGVCIPWQEQRKEYPEIMGDEKIVRKVWEEVDTLGYLYIWACLIQF
jgi:hypothetical protein